MIQIRPAALRIDPPLVLNESVAGSIDGHSHRAVGHDTQEAILAAGVGLVGRCDTRGKRVCARSTLALRLRKLIISATSQALSDDKFKGIVEITAVTPLILRHAVDQLLVAQFVEDPSRYCYCTLHGGGGRECPASSARTLIFDRRHGHN